MGVMGLLVLNFITGLAVLIGAKITKADANSKRRLVIVGCALIIVSLTLAAFLAFILIPSM